MLSAIAELLPLAVTFHRLGMLSAITLPVVRVVGPPLAEAVAANLAILRIGYDLLPVILGAPLPLAYRLAADRLTGLKLRRLKRLLAVTAAAFTHSAVVALYPCSAEWRLARTPTNGRPGISWKAQSVSQQI